MVVEGKRIWIWRWCLCVVLCTHARPRVIAPFWSVSSCTIITPALTMCVHMYSTTPVYMCGRAHAFQACSVWAPACFQYSLLLGGDYPACIWLLSAFDWKLERPGAPWEEGSENFLNPAFTRTPQPLQEPPYRRTGVFSVNNRKFWIGQRNVEVVLRLCLHTVMHDVGL